MTDEELLNLIRTCDQWAGRPFTSAPELAESVDMSRQAIHYRLQQLIEDYDHVRKYKAGQSAIYWIEDEG